MIKIEIIPRINVGAEIIEGYGVYTDNVTINGGGASERNHYANRARRLDGSYILEEIYGQRLNDEWKKYAEFEGLDTVDVRKDIETRLLRRAREFARLRAGELTDMLKIEIDDNIKEETGGRR